MPTSLQITAYTLNELPRRVKDRVIERYRHFPVHDHWYEDIYEHADRAATALGIAINRKPRRLCEFRTAPAIYFSGFACQGSGACFEGHFTSPGDSTKIVESIKEIAPDDIDLLNIATAIQHLLIHTDDKLTAALTHNGSNYVYPRTVSVSCEMTTIEDEEINIACPPAGVERTLTSTLHHFMDWIYRRLEEEYMHLISDDQVSEALAENGFLFTEFGEPASA